MVTKKMEAELALVQEYLDCGALRKVDGKGLAGERENLVVVGCADGHHVVRTLAELVQFTDCPHYLSNNGGALWLAPRFVDPEFAANGEMEVIRRFLRHQIREGLDLKRANRVVLKVHTGCGKAGKHRLTLDKVLTHLMEARAALKDDLKKDPRTSRVKVAGLLRVCGEEPTLYWVNDRHARFAPRAFR